MRPSSSLIAAAFCAFGLATLTSCGGGDDNGTRPGHSEVLHSFGTETPSLVSPTPLVLGADGNFYATALGGAYNDGVIFKITPAGIVSVVHSFGSAPGDGQLPSSLILGSDGNFYGATAAGGTNDSGTVFKMTPDGTESVLYSFGASPADAAWGLGVFLATDGNLYGTSLFGGSQNEGTVFKLSPGGSETVLYSIGSVADGPAGVLSTLVEGDDGALYGVSQLGGTGRFGTVFRITPAGILTLLHSFTGGSNDGIAGSGGALIKGNDGSFYGTASGGGPNGGGIVYQLTPTGVETIVYAFGGNSSNGVGAFPEGPLSEDSQGSIYGGTTYGGYPRQVCGNEGCSDDGASGTIFAIAPGGTATLLTNFGPSAADGSNPSGPPVQGQDGSWYGVTSNGGVDDAGVFYKIIP